VVDKAVNNGPLGSSPSNNLAAEAGEQLTRRANATSELDRQLRSRMARVGHAPVRSADRTLVRSAAVAL
jgi:hypothetical protein